MGKENITQYTTFDLALGSRQHHFCWIHQRQVTMQGKEI